jgi:hypothetical protein
MGGKEEGRNRMVWRGRGRGGRNYLSREESLKKAERRLEGRAGGMKAVYCKERGKIEKKWEWNCCSSIILVGGKVHQNSTDRKEG